MVETALVLMFATVRIFTIYVIFFKGQGTGWVGAQCQTDVNECLAVPAQRPCSPLVNCTNTQGFFIYSPISNYSKEVTSALGAQEDTLELDMLEMEDVLT